MSQNGYGSASYMSRKKASQDFFQNHDLENIINDYYLNNDKGGDIAPAMSMDRLYSTCYNIPGGYGIYRDDMINTVEKLVKDKRIIEFSRKEGGSFWDFESRVTKSYITPDAVFNAVAKRNPNPVQIHEVEKVLSKVGQSLNTALPLVQPAADANEMIKVLLNTLVKRVMEDKPRLTYLSFIDNMKREGFPISMTEKEFRKYVETF